MGHRDLLVVRGGKFRDFGIFDTVSYWFGSGPSNYSGLRNLLKVRGERLIGSSGIFDTVGYYLGSGQVVTQVIGFFYIGIEV